jgi:hypothetical protein
LNRPTGTPPEQNRKWLPLAAAWSVPFVFIQLACWLSILSLPTLMLGSFLILFAGGLFSYPFVSEEGSAIRYAPGRSLRERSLFLRVSGYSSGVGVLIPLLIRWWRMGALFTWI